MTKNTKHAFVGRPRVLVVDDDRGVLSAIRTRLTAAGCNCRTAHDGDEALTELAVHPVDAVITDLRMRRLDGMSVIGLGRRPRDLPLIVITGASDDYLAHTPLPPDTAVLRKPLDMHELMKLLATMLDKQRP